MAETSPASGPRPLKTVRDAPRPRGTGTLQPSAVLTGYWTVRRVRDALDQNDMGSFSSIEMFRTTITRHPRIGGQGGVRGQRIATPLGIKRQFDLPEGYDSADLRSPAARLRDEVKDVFVRCFGHDLHAYLEGELADFGMGFCAVQWIPTGGGGAVVPVIEPWPLSAVELVDGRLTAMLADGKNEPICPGDGRWIMIAASKHEPWRQGAVRSIAEPFISNSQARRDSDRLSEATGQNPVIGSLPESTAAGGDDEKAFRATIEGISTGKQAVLKRDGYAIERLRSHGAEHVEIFASNFRVRHSDIAHAYVGQDGTAEKGSTGTYGAVKVLDGVREDIVIRDCLSLAAADSQLIVPYCYYNHGRSDLAPRSCYLVPDQGEEARSKQAREEKRAARKAFHEELTAFGDGLTPEIVLAVAREHEISCSSEMAHALANRTVMPAASKALPTEKSP